MIADFVTNVQANIKTAELGGGAVQTAEAGGSAGVGRDSGGDEQV